jgi:hypothetical protein
MAELTTKPGWAGYTRTIQVEATNGITVTYGEQPSGDVVIESLTLDGPAQRTFHPAWLLTTTQETATALREELDVGAIQSLDDALHHETNPTS